VRSAAPTSIAGGASWDGGPGRCGLLPRFPAAVGLGRAVARPPLRIAFFTDVHARTEYGVPEAVARAAAAINARKPDFVIGGGDYITDGFQSSAAAVAHRWDVYLAMHRALRPPVHLAIGNHDLVAARPEDGSPPSADPRAIFREKFGLERTYSSFDAGVIISSSSIPCRSRRTRSSTTAGSGRSRWSG